MILTPQGHGLGWTRDDLDPNDYQFRAYHPAPKVFPTLVDLRSKMPPVVDQGQLGSCTGNAWAAAYDYERGKQGLPFMSPSRLFIYYQERVLEGTVNSDSGAQIRSGIKTLTKDGTCQEAAWPYIPSRYSVKPPDPCYMTALKNQALQYMSVAQTAQEMMSALSQGFPIVVGFLVYQGYENVGHDGMIPMPGFRERPLGGHANVIVGYDQARQLWITRNSWSTQWGEQGYGYFPWAYLLNTSLASDFWICEMVEGDPPPPPPTPHVVGAGIMRAMFGEGDTPASDEMHTNSPTTALGASGKVYVYYKDVDRVVVSNGKVYA